MSDLPSKTFIEKCLSGEAVPDEIDDYIDYWHEHETGNILYEFLGMTREEYSAWIFDPDGLSNILADRQE